MTHPQNSPRGARSFQYVEISSSGTGSIQTDSTGNINLTKGLSLSGEETDIITQNSTALFLASGLALSGEATDIITQNSTSVNFSAGIKVSGQENAIMTGLSTGVVLTAIKLGDFWLGANSTTLTIDGAQIATAGDVT